MGDSCHDLPVWFKFVFFAVSLLPPALLIFAGVKVLGPKLCCARKEVKPKANLKRRSTGLNQLALAEARASRAQSAEARSTHSSGELKIDSALEESMGVIEEGDCEDGTLTSYPSFVQPKRRAATSRAAMYNAVSLKWYVWGSRKKGFKERSLNKQTQLAQLSALLLLMWTWIMFNEHSSMEGYCMTIFLHFFAFAATFQIMSVLVSLLLMLMISQCENDAQAKEFCKHLEIFGFFPDVLLAFGLFEGLIGMVFWLFVQLGLVTCTVTMTIVGTLFSTTFNFYQFLVTAIEVVVETSKVKAMEEVALSEKEIRRRLRTFILKVTPDFFDPELFIQSLQQVQGGQLELTYMTRRRAERVAEEFVLETLDKKVDRPMRTTSSQDMSPKAATAEVRRHTAAVASESNIARKELNSSFSEEDVALGSHI